MKRTIVWTVVITLLVVLVIPVAVIASGVLNMGASTVPSQFEVSLAGFAIDRSLAMRAPSKMSPFNDDQNALLEAAEHYAVMCARCHAGPGVEAESFAAGLNPPAPALDHAHEEFSDGELFWIIKHGIRMSGMPEFSSTHADDEIWKLVSLINEFPELNPTLQHSLVEHTANGHRHGHEH